MAYYANTTVVKSSAVGVKPIKNLNYKNKKIKQPPWRGLDFGHCVTAAAAAAARPTENLHIHTAVSKQPNPVAAN